MIYNKLVSNKANFGKEIFIIQDSKSYSYEQTSNIASKAAVSLKEILEDSEEKRILLQLPNSFELIIFLLAADAIRVSVSMISYDYTESEIEDIVRRFDYKVLITNKNFSKINEDIKIISSKDVLSNNTEEKVNLENIFNKDEEETPIIVLTTGTTGVPKGAVYLWSQLINQVNISKKLINSKWLLAYNLNHFAGIQVFLTTLCNASTLIIATNWSGDYLVDLILSKKPEYISATPTFWRMILPLLKKKVEILKFVKQITMGGEAITSNILELSKQLFPNANITQIYAITEVGPVFSTKDGKIGFPYEFITKPEKYKLKSRLKIIEGELYVKSNVQMKGYYKQKSTFTDDGWYPTGDLVKIDNDRVLFLGRKNETINVGGVKVHPIEVEEIILKVQGVKLVKVYGKKNPITGKIVAADIIIDDRFNPEEVKSEILNNCKKYLSRYKIPRIINIKNDIDISNFKIIRREEEE